MAEIVTISKGEDRAATLKACVGNQLQGLIRPGAEVLIKINLVGSVEAERGVTVHHDTLRATLELVRAAGAGRIVVAEDVGIYGDTWFGFRKLGIEAVAREFGAELIALEHQPHPVVRVENALAISEIPYAQPLLQSDVLINLTKMKTHHQGAVSLAMKNMFTAIPEATKLTCHRMDLEKVIVDINTVRSSDFCIIDGFPAVEGIGPALGIPVPMNVVIAGRNMVAVDAVSAAVMGHDPQDIRHIKLAAEKGLGPSRLDQVDVRGLPIAAVARKFRTALDQVKEQVGQYVDIVNHTTCSGCTTVVGTVFMMLGWRPGAVEELKGARVVVGEIPPDEDLTGERLFLVGDCATGCEGYPGFVAGCPPTTCQVMEHISPQNLRLTYFDRETVLGNAAGKRDS